MTNQSRLLCSASIAAFGGFVFGYDASAISGAIVYLTDYFHLSPVGVGWAVSSALFGCMLGSAVVGKVADRFGRKSTLVFAAICYALSGLGTALAWDFGSFWVFRVLGGIAIGLTSAAPLYISEIAPRQSRGRLTALYQLGITFGLLAVCVANWKLSQSNHDWELNYGWRWMLGSIAFPAGLFSLLLTFLPESPRWLLLRDREIEARAVLAKIAGPAQIDEILREHAAQVSTRGTHGQVSLGSAAVLPALLIACALGVLQQTVGINAIIYHGIKLMAGLNLGGGVAGAFFNQVLVGAVIFLSTFIGIALVDRWGRRPLLVVGSLGASTTILTIGIALCFHLEGPWLLGVILLYIVFFGATLGPIVWVLIAELAPDAARARVVGAAALCNWLANAAVSQTFPMINESAINHERFSGALPFFLYGIFGIVFFLFVFFGVPETKGRQLGHM